RSLLRLFASRSPTFFFTAPSPSELYTLSLHDALPILRWPPGLWPPRPWAGLAFICSGWLGSKPATVSIVISALSMRWMSRSRPRSEEHTSELQSRENLVCRLLLEKKKQKKNKNTTRYH